MNVVPDTKGMARGREDSLRAVLELPNLVPPVVEADLWRHDVRVVGLPKAASSPAHVQALLARFYRARCAELRTTQHIQLQRWAKFASGMDAGGDGESGSGGGGGEDGTSGAASETFSRAARRTGSEGVERYGEAFLRSQHHLALAYRDAMERCDRLGRGEGPAKGGGGGQAAGASGRKARGGSGGGGGGGSGGSGGGGSGGSGGGVAGGEAGEPEVRPDDILVHLRWILHRERSLTQVNAIHSIEVYLYTLVYMFTLLSLNTYRRHACSLQATPSSH